MDNRIRILLFSKYQLVQQGLKLLIESNSDLTVVAAHSIDDDIRKLTRYGNSNLAVIDLCRGDRAETISDLLREIPDLRVVSIVEGDDLDSQAAVLRLGAVGIVRKDQDPKDLVAAILQTHKGETWLDQVLLSKILGKERPNGKKEPKGKAKMGIESLTAREFDVIRMIGEGLPNKEVGRRLSISETTVRHHLSSIYGKTGVEDRLNLVILAYKQGWITRPYEHSENGR